MAYIVEEIQSNDGTVGTIVTSYEDLFAAESKYHDILRYAAVSSLQKHTAIILTDEGKLLKRECYNHEPPVEVPQDETSEG